jgi:hypothetical protein
MAQITDLPATVFRYIEYLEAKKPDQEVGIYRLNGSSSVIESLKNWFIAVCKRVRNQRLGTLPREKEKDTYM